MHFYLLSKVKFQNVLSLENFIQNISIRNVCTLFYQKFSNNKWKYILLLYQEVSENWC